MNWDDIRVFLALHEHRTFRHAAKALKVHGSTVSRRLEALEEAVGVPLFDRTPDGLLPTPAAARILPTAREIEVLASRLENVLQGMETAAEGVVRVAALESLATHLLAPRVPRLIAAHPKVTLELVPGTALLDLTRRQADIAIRVVRPTAGDLVYKQVATTQMAVFGHRDLVGAGDGPVEPGSLPWCAWNFRDSPNPDARWLQAHVPDHALVLLSGQMDVLLRAVAAGAGVAMLPSALCHGYGELVQIPVTVTLPPPLPLYLVCHRALRSVPRVDVVWDFLTEALSEVTASEGG